MDKVPSEMRYTPTGLKWGFQADEVLAKGTKIQYMKLLLEPSQKKIGQGRDQLAQVRLELPPGKLPVDVVSDYLKCLKDHALDVLSNTYGPNVWESTPIEYYLVIPAV